MDRKSQPHHPWNKRALRTLAAGTALGVAAGFAVGSSNSGDAAANAQPGCEVKATPSDVGGLDTMVQNLDNNGGHVSGKIDVVAADGHVRSPNTDPNFTVNDSHGLQAGDMVRFEHVSAGTCVAVGGTVLADNVELVPKSHSGVVPVTQNS